MLKKRFNELENKINNLELKIFDLEQKQKLFYERYKVRTVALEEYLGVELKREFHEPVEYKFIKKGDDDVKGA